jgi:hypothetical protein
LDTANRENQNWVEVDKNITKYKVQFWDTLFTIFKARYEDVKGYGSFLNKFNELQNNKNFTITDLNKVIKAWDTINLP